MANKISTSFVTDPSIQQPFTAKSLDFLQNRISEDIRGIVYNMIGENLYGYSGVAGVAVSGCDKSGGGNTIFNGWIYYSGELYYFPGAMGLLSYSNVPVIVLDETNDGTIDPVTFSDLIPRSVHKIRRLKVVDQLSGTGLFDLNNLGKIIHYQEVTPTNFANTGAIAESVTGATFTSPNRICDLEICFQYDLTMEQVTSGSVSPNIVLKYGGGGGTQLRVSAHRMSGFGAAANQKIQSRGYIKYVYRNCPASTVIFVRLENAPAANETLLSNMVLSYEEIVKPALW